MGPMGVSLIALACIFGGALVGRYLGSTLPEPHLSEDSKDSVKLGMGLVATMCALGMGLLTCPSWARLFRTYGARGYFSCSVFPFPGPYGPG